MSKFICEYEERKVICGLPAVARFTKYENDPSDGPMTYETYRCGAHAETAAGYKAEELNQAPRPTGLNPIFMEALRPFAPTLFETATEVDGLSKCCGAPVNDSNRCTNCWEVA